MPQIFISYSRRDLDFVEQMATDLRAVGLDVWYDLSGLEGGSRWRLAIEKAIRESQYVVVVLSPDSVDSEWVEREYLFSSNLGKNIIPVLYKKCDLPLYYLNIHYIDIQGGNYKRNFGVLVKVLGVHTTETSKTPAVEQETPTRPKAVEKLNKESKPKLEKVSRLQGWKPMELVMFAALIIMLGVLGFSLFDSPATMNIFSRTPASMSTEDPQNLTFASTQTMLAQSTLNVVPASQTSMAVIPTIAAKETATTTAVCGLAQFVSDVTIPDGTQLSPGENFTKTWRFKNTGTCTWTTDYAFIFISGDQMGGPAVQNLSQNVPPGGTVEISVDLQAPDVPGHYRGFWKFRTPTGEFFSIGSDGNGSIWVDIVVTVSLSIEITDDKGVEMVLVPEGEFTMGNSAGDPDESPEHTVNLDAFYLDKYEVTHAFYKVCVNMGACRLPKGLSGINTKYNNANYQDHPVVYVDWNMANTYCEWRGAHLPTEAEWEKAARGTDDRIYPWGGNIDCSYANYSGCTGDTSVAGSYAADVSPFGVYDMAGNVSEWVADWYSETYYQISPQSNPIGPATGQFGIRRGGDWYDIFEGYDAYSVRVSNRTRYNRGSFGSDLGFRCAKDANP